VTSGLPLAAGGFDRAAARRSDAEWLADAWTRAQVVPISPQSTVPVHDGRLEVRPAVAAPEGVRRFLGLVEDVPHFAVTTQPRGENWQTLREFGARADDLEASLVTCAVALEQWHQRHVRCPRCGSTTTETQAGWTRTCTADGSEHFPRTDPAVIMLVHDGGDRALLGRQPSWPKGRYSTIAGFVEAGESSEQAVHREVREETGVLIDDVVYRASQPWPFPQSLMLGYEARVIGGEVGTGDDELEDVRWFDRDELRHDLETLPPNASIAHWLITGWLNRA